MMIDQLVDWRVSGVLLDIRGHSEAASACALARIAAPAVCDMADSPVECTVTVVRPDGTPFTAATTDGAGGVSRWDQLAGRGPTSRALGGSLTLILNAHSLDKRWDEYQATLKAAGFRSAVALPLQLERGYRAALTLYSAETNVFTPVVATQALAFSDVAAKSLVLALQVRAGLAQSADLRAAMASRTAINTACGVIMGQNQCSYEAAFQMLALASSQRNLTIRDVAEGILGTLPGGVPPTDFQQLA